MSSTRSRNHVSELPVSGRIEDNSKIWVTTYVFYYRKIWKIIPKSSLMRLLIWSTVFTLFLLVFLKSYPKCNAKSVDPDQTPDL